MLRPSPLVAAIDIGSNAIRLAVAESVPGGEPGITLFRRVPVRFGDSVFRTGSVDEETVARAEAAMVEFRGILSELDVTHARAVATNALRAAINGPAVASRLRAALGWPLEVIDAGEEARLVAVAMEARIGPPEGLDLVIDLGGGSSQWSLITRAGIAWSGSFPIGAVRLRDALQPAPDAANDEFLDRWLAPALADLAAAVPAVAHEHQDIRRLLLSGGNAETLQDLAIRLLGRSPGGLLLAQDLAFLADALAHQPADTREATFELPPNRADVIVPAARLFLRAMTALTISSALVPRTGLKEGILVEMQEAALAGSGSTGHRDAATGDPEMIQETTAEIPRASSSMESASSRDLARHYVRALTRGTRRYERWVRRLRRHPGGRTIHALRIAARRLVALLDLAAPGRPDAGASLQASRESARALRRELAPARDLQAASDRLADLAIAGLPARVVARLLDDQLDIALEKASRSGGRKRAEALTAPLHALVDEIKEQLGTASATLAAAMTTAIRERRNALVEAVDVLDEEDTASIHAVRVALKKYRYAAEALEPFLSADAGAELELLANLQSHLGAVQDFDILKNSVEALVGAPEDSSALHATMWNAIQREQEERIAEACERIEGHDWLALSNEEIMVPFEEELGTETVLVPPAPEFSGLTVAPVLTSRAPKARKASKARTGRKKAVKPSGALSGTSPTSKTHNRTSRIKTSVPRTKRKATPKNTAKNPASTPGKKQKPRASAKPKRRR